MSWYIRRGMWTGLVAGSAFGLLARLLADNHLLPGVLLVRHALFERGVLFVETVTVWKEDEELSFSIAAQTDAIPPSTLDRHVIIGGPYFDVLDGTYRIEALDGDRVLLHLSSRTRVSTHFNLYAGPWSDAVMRSIQRNILEVIRARAESGAEG